MWRAKHENWEGSPHYDPVADGKTLDEATGAAIERWEKKHGIKTEEPAESSDGVRWLHVRGWVS